MTTPADFPALLSRFFNTHLIQRRQASPHTVASYRDTFRLLVHGTVKLTGIHSFSTRNHFESTRLISDSRGMSISGTSRKSVNLKVLLDCIPIAK